MYIPILLAAFAIILFYLTYRVLRAEKDVLLEMLRYLFAAVLVGFAILFIVAALKYVNPICGNLN